MIYCILNKTQVRDNYLFQIRNLPNIISLNLKRTIFKRNQKRNLFSPDNILEPNSGSIGPYLMLIFDLTPNFKLSFISHLPQPPMIKRIRKKLHMITIHLSRI